jgi:hypothetical protein
MPRPAAQPAAAMHRPAAQSAAARAAMNRPAAQLEGAVLVRPAAAAASSRRHEFRSRAAGSRGRRSGIARVRKKPAARGTV